MSLLDSWFSSNSNMKFIHKKGKQFIFDIKGNRNVCFSQAEREAGTWTRLSDIDIPKDTPTQVWFKDLDIAVVVIKQVFTNKDGSVGVRFLVSNNLSLSSEDFTMLYKKRWGVEEYHKSMKQNAGLAKSPTRTVRTQTNHIFASIMAYVKLERLKFVHKINHFAMKSKIYVEASKAAYKQLTELNEKLLESTV